MSQEIVNVKIKRLSDNAVIPFYASDLACGMDLTAIDLVYSPDNDYYEYHTGLAFELPEGYYMQIAPRSSNRKTDSYLTNSIGWLDADYRGELLVCFKNRNSSSLLSMLQGIAARVLGPDIANKIRTDVMNNAPYKVGDRVAQINILPYPKVQFEEVEELSTTIRGEGGHGSTGN